VTLLEREAELAAVEELVAGAAAGEEGLRAVAQTIYHPACTCRIGSDALAVLDGDLGVRGVEGLRVADASAMPTLPRAHTQAATYAIAERAAALLAGQPSAPPVLTTTSR
jgi:choline dehydrogenase